MPERFFSSFSRAKFVLEFDYDMPNLSFFWTPNATQDGFCDYAYENQEKYVTRSEDGADVFDMDAALEDFFRSRHEYPFHPDERLQLIMLHASRLIASRKAVEKR